MEQWFVSHPNLVWPIMLILGVIGMAIIWNIASAMYEQLSGILAGAAFMIVGFGLVLYCAFRLLSQSPPASSRCWPAALALWSVLAQSGPVRLAFATPRTFRPNAVQEQKSYI